MGGCVFKHMPQTGRREGIHSEKASRSPRHFSCHLEKQDGSHWEPNSICSIIADSDLCVIKSNSIFPIWRSVEEGILAHFPQAPL